MTEYTSVTLPRTLLLRVDQYKRRYGYTSRADFVKNAIRKELERLERRIEILPTGRKNVEGEGKHGQQQQ